MKTLLTCLGLIIAMGTQAQQRTVVLYKVTGAPIDSFSCGLYTTGKSDTGRVLTADGYHKYILNLKEPTSTNTLVGTSSNNPMKEYTYLTKQFIYLDPGDSLVISYDIHHQDSTLTISGKGAVNNKILTAFREAAAAAYKKLGSIDSASTDEYKEYLYNIKNGRNEILGKEGYLLSADLLKRLAVKTHVEFAMGLLGTPGMLKIYQQKKLSECIPEGYWSFGKLVKIDEGLLNNRDYVSLLTYSYPNYLILKQQHANGTLDKDISREQHVKDVYNIAKTTYKDPVVKSVVLAKILKRLLGSAAVASKYRGMVYSYLENDCKDDKIRKSLLVYYQKRASLGKGQVPPSFPMEDLQGNKVTLADFKGKVVYMDFWASWCSPCRYQMKHGAPGLFKQFKDKNVVFLDVSIDDSKAKWLTAVHELDIEGTQVRSPGGFNSMATKTFDIMGVPHYILIGRDGKIYDNDATRPTQPETAETIAKLLK